MLLIRQRRPRSAPPLLFPALALLLALGACAGSTAPGSDSGPPADLARDSGDPAREAGADGGPADLSRPEAGRDGPLSDQRPTVDQFPRPDGPPAGCVARTKDGLFLNPGCDPDVRSAGITAMDSFTRKGATSWIVLSGRKWWLFEMQKGAFVEGGKDIAAYLRLFQPDCTKKTSSGLHLNPGCDLDLQTKGVTALGNLTSGSKPSWLVVTEKKWWGLDLDKGTFTNAGADIQVLLRGSAPGCTAKTADGIPLNPGCDPVVAQGGLSVLDVTTSSGKTGWFVMSGPRYWSLDLSLGAGGTFTAGGKNPAAMLKTLAPGCAAKAADGTPLNPGCDPTVALGGFSAVSSASDGKNTVWLLCRDKKFWSYDSAAAGGGAFTAAGADVATFFRTLKP